MLTSSHQREEVALVLDRAKPGAGLNTSCEAILPVVEIVANVGVAIGGIVPQALVELEGLIVLRDLGARVSDWRRIVGSSSRRLPDQWRSR